MLTRLRSPAAAARWLRAWVSGTLCTDSRRVRPGDGFIAWPGYASDGRHYVQAALDAGAAGVLVEADGVEAYGFSDARIGALPRLKAATGAIADAWFEHPSEKLRVVASTGTNGKTSTTWWTAQALTLLGRRCGVVGTLGVGVPPVGDSPSSIAYTGLTTPDPVTLHAGLRRMADAGYAACAIEASSIGLVEERLAATRIEVALFTNFTRDHLDFHGDMDSYWSAKRRLFDWPGLEAASINVDDPRGAALAAELAGGPLELWSSGLRDPAARLRASGLCYADGGLAFTLHEGERALPVRSTLIGDYNASNLLVVIGGLRALGVPLEDAVAIVPRLTPVPGRMQRVGDGVGVPEVVVDYAHTPDALEKTLLSLRPLAAARNGRLVCLFGCGGNRDASKRPLMGAIAQRLADRVTLTSDNPRHEPPAEILAQIVAGQDRRDRATVIEDRRAAIAQVVAQAGPRDVILLAGKGHEDYQEVAGVKQPFSDVDEARAALAARGEAS
ncbi:MAG TPA: UDP-N-acetylmuramoyl-L-alanyl-D-glutamate--2,6-diaminopimelate ligase [Methylibium sp.]|nr:UDP-N-acetylmuramoyl-L-alanyl-D-glutamate--2,6-diaminopimelate ligase [Methylibium sp.]